MEISRLLSLMCPLSKSYNYLNRLRQFKAYSIATAISYTIIAVQRIPVMSGQQPASLVFILTAQLNQVSPGQYYLRHRKSLASL